MSLPLQFHLNSSPLSTPNPDTPIHTTTHDSSALNPPNTLDSPQRTLASPPPRHHIPTPIPDPNQPIIPPRRNARLTQTNTRNPIVLTPSSLPLRWQHTPNILNLQNFLPRHSIRRNILIQSRG